MKILEEAWSLYRNQCVPEGASDGQVEATKHAFYAGAHFLFPTLDAILAGNTAPAERGLEVIRQIREELAEVFVNVPTAKA